MLEFNKNLFNELLKKASENPRLRQNYDLRTSADDTSQRMLNALLPGTVVAIHRHPKSCENVICLMGKMDEILYDDNGNEIERVHLCPSDGKFGCNVPMGTWHSVYIYEPTVMFEAKDCKYGEDGSETFYGKLK